MRHVKVWMNGSFSLKTYEKKMQSIGEPLTEWDKTGLLTYSFMLHSLGMHHELYQSSMELDSTRRMQSIVGAYQIHDYFLPPEKRELANFAELIVASQTGQLFDLGTPLYDKYRAIPSIWVDQLERDETYYEKMKSAADRLQPEALKTFTENEKQYIGTMLTRIGSSTLYEMQRRMSGGRIVKTLRMAEVERRDDTPYIEGAHIDREKWRSIGRDSVGAIESLEVGGYEYEREQIAWSWALHEAVEKEKESIWIIARDEEDADAFVTLKKDRLGEESIARWQDATTERIIVCTPIEFGDTLYNEEVAKHRLFYRLRRSVIYFQLYDTIPVALWVKLARRIEQLRLHWETSIVSTRVGATSYYDYDRIRHFGLHHVPAQIESETDSQGVRATVAQMTYETLVEQVAEQTVIVAATREQGGYIVDTFWEKERAVLWIDPQDSLDVKEEKLATYDGTIPIVTTERLPIRMPTVYEQIRDTSFYAERLVEKDGVYVLFSQSAQVVEKARREEEQVKREQLLQCPTEEVTFRDELHFETLGQRWKKEKESFEKIVEKREH